MRNGDLFALGMSLAPRTDIPDAIPTQFLGKASRSCATGPRAGVIPLFSGHSPTPRMGLSVQRSESSR
jgi:hypothetical protein